MRFFFAFLLVAACAGPATVVNDWTGAVTRVSDEHEVFREGQGRMSVRAATITLDGRKLWGVLTSVRRTGPNAPRVQRVESGPTPLAYQRLDRLFTHCLDRCQRAETGFVSLSQAAFTAAGRTGLPLRVTGRRGRYEGTVPARAFGQLIPPAGAQ